MKKEIVFITTDHLKGQVKAAIKTAGFKPKLNEPFENSQKCVALQSIFDLSYAEGVVVKSDGVPSIHAWVVDERKKHHELTIKPFPKIICYRLYSKNEVRNRIKQTKCYEPMDDEWCRTVLNAHMLGISTDKTIEDLQNLIEEKFISGDICQILKK